MKPEFAMTRELIEIMRNEPSNLRCVDCSVVLSDSIWASVTFGAFLCINCAGVHRKLGVHLSRVKSVHMDAWTEDEVNAMRKGNAAVNEIYERYIVDVQMKLSPGSDMNDRENWIRAKYEKQLFMTPIDMPEKDKKVEHPVVEVAKRFVDYFVVIGKGQITMDQDCKYCFSGCIEPYLTSHSFKVSDTCGCECSAYRSRSVPKQL